MLIAWFTVAAQLINFLILIWLMQRFLYKPILDAIAAREKGITQRLADAEATEKEAQQERDNYRKKNEEFDQEYTTRRGKATKEIQAERERRLKEVEQEAQALGEKRKLAFDNDSKEFNQNFAHRIRNEVFFVARKALQELANVPLEAQMTEVLIHRLRTLPEQSRDELRAILAASNNTAVLRSVFAIEPEQQHAVGHALGEIFAVDVQLQFETAPDLISGIELLADGHKVTWSIAAYLDAIEKETTELLKAKNA